MQTQPVTAQTQPVTAQTPIDNPRQKVFTFSKILRQNPKSAFLLRIMPNTTIEPSRYLHFPRLGVRSGLSLGRQLLTVVPADSEPAVPAAAEALKLAVEHLEAQWKAKTKPHPTLDVRPYDHRLDRSWSIIERSLDRYTAFDPGNANRARAAHIHARLFPTGLDFITLPYAEQHAESRRRVELIEEEGLRKDLERLVGTDFVVELLAAHMAYGMVLRITAAREDAPSISLVAPLRALTQAISSYALQVLAFASHDPENNNAPARRAFGPIDAFRSAVSRRRARRGNEPLDLDNEDRVDEPMTEDPESRQDAEANAIANTVTSAA